MRFLLFPLTIFLFAHLAVFGQSTSPVQTQAVTPSFPDEVLSKIYGNHKIDLFLEVDKNGKVKNVDAFGPWKRCYGDDGRPESLRKAAIDAAKNILFSPALEDGKAIDGTVTMSYPIQGTMERKAITSPRKTGGVVNGKRISIPTPKYPAKAKKYRVFDEVVILAQIDEQGNMYSVSAISGHPLLLESAADAACGAKFTPTLFAGEPVKVGVQLHFNFRP